MFSFSPSPSSRFEFLWFYESRSIVCVSLNQLHLDRFVSKDGSISFKYRRVFFIFYRIYSISSSFLFNSLQEGKWRIVVENPEPMRFRFSELDSHNRTRRCLRRRWNSGSRIAAATCRFEACEDLEMERQKKMRSMAVQFVRDHRAWEPPEAVAAPEVAEDCIHGCGERSGNPSNFF